MAREKSPKKRRIFPMVLLALVCILITELVVCKYMAPELYDRITQPVVSAVQTLPDRVISFFHQISLPSFSPPDREEPEEESVDQRATDPALEEPLVLEDRTVTEFSTQNGQELITGGVVDMVYFNQAEQPWASQPFGPDHIGGYGCGPTSLAMIISTLTGEVVDPAVMSKWAYQQGYCAPGSGSYASIVMGTAKAYGVTAFPWEDLSAEAITQGLAAGNIFMVLMTRGHFTSSGHYMVLRGLTQDGKILVADPNSRDRSLTAWDPQLIADELSPTRSSGAPIWGFPALSIQR